jgi:hypothetical protein
LRFGGVQLGLVRCLGGNIGIQLFLWNSALCGERPVPGDIGVCVGQIRHRHGHLRFGFRKCRLEGVRVYLIEKLSFFYEKAIVVVLREQIALNSRRDLGVIASVELRHPLGIDGHISLDNFCDLDLRRPWFRSHLLGLASRQKRDEKQRSQNAFVALEGFGLRSRSHCHSWFGLPGRTNAIKKSRCMGPTSLSRYSVHG